MHGGAIGELGGLKRRERPLGRQVDAEIVQEGGYIFGPAHRDGAGTHGIFENEVPADNPADKLAERRIRVGVGAAGGRDHACEFGIAHAREAAANRSNHKADDDGRPRIVPRSKAGQGKKARADNRTYAEGNQVERAERAVKLHPLRIVIAPGNLFALK